MALKKIQYDVRLLSTDKTLQGKTPRVYTNDLNSAEFVFNILDMTPEQLAGATATTMLYMRDCSFFQNSDVEFDGTTFAYLLKENEGNHSGLAKIQLVVKIGTAEYASQLYNFEVVNGLETKVAKAATEVMIKDWTTLTRDARAYIAQFVADEAVRQQQFETSEANRATFFETAETSRTTAETNRVSAEQSRVSAETGRIEAEQSRAEAEGTRQTTFTTNEANRTETFNANEANRTETFNANEATRQENESIRQQAETQRATAETNRTTAETNRVSAEQWRVTAETGRVDAENSRASAESARVTTEQARVSAETQRALSFADLQNKINTNELIDMRLGADGKTYSAAGDAVRNQLFDISVLSQEYTVYFGFSTPPKFNRNGSILEIAMPKDVRLFAIDKNGKIKATIYAAGSTTDTSLPTFNLTYNLNHNQALILNVDEKKVITTGITDARNYRHVVLAYNYQGVLAAGDFIKYDARNIVLPKSYTIFFTNGTKPKITEGGGAVTIDMPTATNAVLYAVDNTGKEVGKLQSPTSGGNKQFQTQYILSHGQSLIWKIATNELVVQHINGARTQTDIVLAYNHANYLSAGEFERYRTRKIDNANLDNFSYSNYDFVLRQSQINGYPENSIAGLLEGKSKGYNHARMSVKFTSDGHAILSHDNYLNYKIKNIDGTDTDTSIAISSLTLSVLKNNYDFGLYYGQQFKGMKVSTLDELITAAAYNGIKLDLELKDSIYTDAMVDYIVDRLVLNGLVDSTLISSGDLAVLNKFFAKCPALSFGYICNPNNTRVDEILGYRHLNNQLRLDIFDKSILTVPVALYAKSNGIKIKVGSCYSVNDIRKWISSGADVIEVAYIANPIETLSNYYKNL